MRYSIADRLKARARQLGINAAHVAELAGVNRSFIYDIMRGRSENPNLDRLQRIADALRVDRNWLLHGLGNLEGESPIIEHPDDIFVAVRSVRVRATMGSGVVVEQPAEDGKPYHFQKSWIRDDLKARPPDLRMLHVEGDSMLPTLNHGDIVLVDLSRTTPSPPGLFVLFDGLGLVAKRLEHIAGSDPPTLRILSDNALYAPYERSAEEVSIVGRIRWLARGI